MKLYFIRHGETDWNRQGRIQGTNDIDLNETGIEQAEMLGQKLKASHPHITKVYSSRKRRASDTAAIISRSIGTDHQPLDGLEEVNLGLWEGLTWKQVKESFPEEYEEWYNHRGPARPPEGESYHEVVDRVTAVVRRIISEGDGDVAIVTHGAVLMSLQCHVHGTPYAEMNRYLPGNTGLVELDSGLFACI